MAMSCSFEDDAERKAFGVNKFCSFCGESRTAGVWSAPRQMIGCCRSCATGVLPALIADCLVDTGIPTLKELRDFNLRVMGKFAKGMAHAMSVRNGLFWADGRRRSK